LTASANSGGRGSSPRRHIQRSRTRTEHQFLDIDEHESDEELLARIAVLLRKASTRETVVLEFLIPSQEGARRGTLVIADAAQVGPKDVERYVTKQLLKRLLEDR
jgi:hypothetical protein